MPSKIKVLQVIPKLGYGGAETGCYDIAHYLYEKNCDSYLVTSGGDLLKFVDKKKVKVIRLPVHSKNPLLILVNAIILTFLIIFLNINIVHARSRAPAWSCYLATKITRRNFVTTFHGTYNFQTKIKKFYNSIMVRSKLIIAGSNFIFTHIKENYLEYIDLNKKLLVIFRGINVDYFDQSSTIENDEIKLKKKWEIEENKKIILLNEVKDKREKMKSSLLLQGLTPGMSVHYANCCNPIFGDSVISYISEGKGLIVHQESCEELKKIKVDNTKIINVTWEKISPKRTSFSAKICVTIKNKIGTLGVLSSILGKSLSNIRNLNITERNADFFKINLEIDVKDVDHLSNVIGSLRSSEFIINVLRL